MPNIVETILADVCLDERVADGIFRMDEAEHMNALRDYLVKRGLTKEAAVHVTNRMVEGKYPERQAWRKEDGILVTFPSPQHKSKAIQKNPGKYTDKDPKPKQPEEPKTAPPGSKPEPGEKPAPEKDGDGGLPKSDEKEPDDKKEPTIFQGDMKLEIEPPRGDDKLNSPPAPAAPTLPPQPRTPERIAAEKEIVNRIMRTDDTTLSNVADPINEECKRQLRELYKKADELGLRKAVTFLTPYV